MIRVEDIKASTANEQIVPFQDHSYGCFSHSAQGEGLQLLWSFISDLILRSNVYDLMIRQQRKKFKALAKLAQD